MCGRYQHPLFDPKAGNGMRVRAINVRQGKGNNQILFGIVELELHIFSS